MSERQGMVLTSGQERKKYVRHMFNNIARRYDFLNHFLSAGIDIYWRKRAIAKLQVEPEDRVLDLACGTGDFALEAWRSKGCKVVGTDIALRMLQYGQKKIGSEIPLVNGDGELLPFNDGIFAGVTIAFGIRNMGTIPDALKEMSRILKSNGQAVILEFSLPRNILFRKLYIFYFKNILPLLGKLISRDTDAYSYLPASVEKFPETTEFKNWMLDAGFKRVEHIDLLNGVAVIYSGHKV